MICVEKVSISNLQRVTDNSWLSFLVVVVSVILQMWDWYVRLCLIFPFQILNYSPFACTSQGIYLLTYLLTYSMVQSPS